MHKAFLIFGLLIMGMLAPGVISSQAQIEYIYHDPLLDFNIQSDKEAYQSGDVIKLSLMFKNKGKADLDFCIFDIERRLRGSLAFETANEKVGYRLSGWFKDKLPIVTPKDFIILKPGQEHRIELAVETVLPGDLSWRFVDCCPNPPGLIWGGGSLKISDGEYKVHAVYMSVPKDSQAEVYEPGHYLRPKDVPVENTWSGNLVSNSIPVRIGAQAQSVSLNAGK